MKKRICLVGFEGAEMVALHSTMASIGGAWDCIFVGDAPAAMEVIRSGPCDAVVANMDLPGQSGAELLQAVNEAQPQALRFIIGEAEDQAFIIESIGGTHQFIARPVQPQELIARIQRGLALDAWLSTEELRKLTPRLRRLPSLPSTYFELLKQVESSNTNLKVIGEVIARDPAVTVRLLQMVNSAALALEQKVTDPTDAVALLGVETVKSLVLCLQVFSQTDEAKQAGISLEELWDHSVTVANFARQITMRETGDARLANDAFTAGLLHDVGRIVIASNLPREYAAIVSAAREQSRPLHEEEQAQLGVTHAQVGAYLLGLWGMPAPLLEVAAAHHTPDRTSGREFSLLTAVHAANVFAHAKAAKSDSLPLPEINLAYFEVIGLADRPEAWRQLVTGETAVPAKTKPQTKPKQQKQPAAAHVVPRLEARSSGLPKFLIPAGAVLLVGVIVFAWSQLSALKQPIPVNAKTANPPVAAPAPVVEAAHPAEPQVETPVATVETPEVKPVVPEPATVVTKETSQPPAEEPKPEEQTTVVKAPATGFDSLKVQGVFYRTANPVAIINGKTLGVGGKINGAEVLAIEPTMVTLSLDGVQKSFKVK